MGEAKVIARIKGGLGNQLFCYAAARRLAIRSRVPLILDDKTGFVRDRKYRRTYVLDRFNISCQKATSSERMEPLERYRRGIAKYLSRLQPFHSRTYIEQDGNDFDPRLLELRVRKTTYLDGYWQSEAYFRDVATQIHEDLRMPSPSGTANREMAERIRSGVSVSVHIRFFGAPQRAMAADSPLVRYYSDAMEEMERCLEAPEYFVFSDEPEMAYKILGRQRKRATFVAHNSGGEGPGADLWLMSQCKHSIVASSTFSWWAAWLSEGQGGNIIVVPDKTLIPGVAWAHRGLIPDRWTRIRVRDGRAG